MRHALALALVIAVGCTTYPAAECAVAADGSLYPVCVDGGGLHYDDDGTYLGWSAVGCHEPRAVRVSDDRCGWNIGERTVCGEDGVPRCDDGSPGLCVFVPPSPSGSPNPDDC